MLLIVVSLAFVYYYCFLMPTQQTANKTFRHWVEEKKIMACNGLAGSESTLKRNCVSRLKCHRHLLKQICRIIIITTSIVQVRVRQSEEPVCQREVMCSGDVDDCCRTQLLTTSSAAQRLPQMTRMMVPPHHLVRLAPLLIINFISPNGSQH